MTQEYKSMIGQIAPSSFLLIKNWQIIGK
jgi:hypothetical protein